MGNPKTLEGKVNSKIRKVCKALEKMKLPVKRCPACKRPVATCNCERID